MNISDHEWKPCSDFAAPIGLLCLFWREGWGEPIVSYVQDIVPEENIVGLYWKLSGIGREQLDSLPWQMQQQLQPILGGLGSLLGGLWGIGSHA